MASAGKVFRLSTSGAEQTSREFGKVGDAGRKMGADIAKGAKGISPAMRGLDTAVGQAKGSIDGLAGRAGALGGVLSSMGPIGLAAAAGIGALGAAFFEAARRGEQAIEWAESLELLSERLDTSTRSVQEWRFAASQFGVDTAKTDEALGKLNQTIGQAERGLPKAVKLFQALGFTDEQIAGFRDVDSVLPQIAEKLAGLSPAARDGLAKKLGLTELLPLLKDGRVGVEDLKKQFDELGLVISDRALAKAAEDNDRLDISTARAENAMQRLNLQLTPVASLWGDAKTAVIEYFEQVIAGFQQVEDRGDLVLRKQLESLRERIEDAQKVPFLGGAIQSVLIPQAQRIEETLRQNNRAAMRRNTAAGSSRTAVLDEDEEDGGGGKVKASIDPARAAAESYIKTQMEAMRVREGLNAVEAQGLDLSQDDIKSKWELIEAYRRIDEARKLGVKLTDAEAQALKDSIKADQDKAAALRERDAAQRIVDERQSRADSARQFFESPLMRYKREAEELRDLQRGGELSAKEAEESLRALANEYDEVAASMFESTKAGQLLDGVLRGQIKSVGDLGRAFLELAKGDAIKALYASLGSLFGLTDGAGGKSKGGGLFKSILSAGLSLFGGGRATGGPVTAGMFYRVNENTPRSEWFVPKVDGTILTAAQADRAFAQQSGGAGGSISIDARTTVDARGADQSAIPGIKAALADHEARMNSLLANFSGLTVASLREAMRHNELRGILQ